MKRLALVVLLVTTAAVAAAQANATKGWHRCQLFSSYGRSSLCDGRRHVLFPFTFQQHDGGGYAQVVTGFRQTTTRRAIVDTYAKIGTSEGECGQHGVIRDCKWWALDQRIRYQTSDGGQIGRAH